MATHKFGLADIGCFGDGAAGHDHIRRKLRTALLTAHKSMRCSIELNAQIGDVAESLLGEMPDDAWDEQDALDILNCEACEDGVLFVLEGGDLLLTTMDID